MQERSSDKRGLSPITLLPPITNDSQGSEGRTTDQLKRKNVLLPIKKIKIAEPGGSLDPKMLLFLGGITIAVFMVPLTYSQFPWGK